MVSTVPVPSSLQSEAVSPLQVPVPGTHSTQPRPGAHSFGQFSSLEKPPMPSHTLATPPSQTIVSFGQGGSPVLDPLELEALTALVLPLELPGSVELLPGPALVEVMSGPVLLVAPVVLVRVVPEVVGPLVLVASLEPPLEAPELLPAWVVPVPVVVVELSLQAAARRQQARSARRRDIPPL